MTRGPHMGAWKLINSMVVCAGNKRSHPTCRACNSSIDNLRIGLMHQHVDGFVIFRWYHLQCIRRPASIDREKIEGLDDPEVLPYIQQFESWFNGTRPIESMSNNPSSATETSRLPVLHISNLDRTNEPEVKAESKTTTKSSCRILNPACPEVFQTSGLHHYN